MKYDCLAYALGTTAIPAIYDILHSHMKYRAGLAAARSSANRAINRNR